MTPLPVYTELLDSQREFGDPLLNRVITGSGGEYPPLGNPPGRLKA